MEAIVLTLTGREFNFIVDALEEIAGARIRGNPMSYAHTQQQKEFAQDILDGLMKERRDAQSK